MLLARALGFFRLFPRQAGRQDVAIGDWCSSARLPSRFPPLVSALRFRQSALRFRFRILYISYQHSIFRILYISHTLYILHLSHRSLTLRTAVRISVSTKTNKRSYGR